MSAILLRGGTAVTPEGVREVDLLLRGGVIERIGSDLPAEADRQVVDCAGMLVLPGAVDPHTHMGIPIKSGRSADDFRTGSLAALHGGVTTILDFTVLGPGRTLAESVEERLRRAEASHADYGLHCNVTRYSPELLAEIPALIGRGITSFKVFTAYEEAGMRLGYDRIREVAEVVGGHGGLLMAHAEDGDVLRRAMAEIPDRTSTDPRLHGLSRPDEAEETAVRRLAGIARETGCPVYIVHLSSARGLAAGRGRENVLLESCPQYLLLDENAYGREDGRMFVASPPLRKPEDREALWEAVASGVIAALGTDHCPFRPADKPPGTPFPDIPNGIGGVETLLPLMLHRFLERGLGLERLVRLVSTNPAKLFGLFPRKGVLAEGADADIVLVDPGDVSEITPERLASPLEWNAYTGLRAVFPRHVFRRGEWVVRDGEIDRPGRGEFLPSRPRGEGESIAL